MAEAVTDPSNFWRCWLCGDGRTPPDGIDVMEDFSRHLGEKHPRHPAAGPGEDVRAEAREQIAAAIAVETAGWETFTADDGYAAIRQREKRTPHEIADAVLAVPSIADALAAVEKVRRVEALAQRWFRSGEAPWAIELRRALGEGGRDG